MNFDNKKGEEIRNSIKYVLKEVERKYDIEIDLSNIVCNGEETYIKTIIEKSEDVVLRRKEEFLKHCKEFGFEEDDFMKDYNYYGMNFKILGIFTEYPETPIYIEDEYKHRYFAKASSVKENIECCKRNITRNIAVVPF